MPTDIFPVTANADDGYRYSTTTFAITATICGNNGSAGNNYSTFLRFTNITIPQGAVISNAKLLFVCLSGPTGTGCNTRITGEHADNPAAVTSQVDWDNRVKTTKFVDWDGIPTWIVGQPYESPNIANVIQDIIEEDWWDSGDAIQIFWEEHGAVVASGNYRYPADYSHASYTEPRLEVTWLDSGSVELPAKFAVRHMTPVDLLSKFEIPTTFTLSGRTRDRDGNRLGNCEVALFRTIEGNPPTYLFIESDMSDANAFYSFTGLIRTKYFVRGRKEGSPNVFDTT
ncbi:unnamed protein product, partial [marine sediment metagenome]